MAKWEATWTPKVGATLDIGASGEAIGIYMSGPRRVSAPERTKTPAQSHDGDGQVLVDEWYGNRTITYPLRISCATQAEMFAAQALIAAMIGQSKEQSGGTLVEVPPDGSEMTWIVVGIESQDVETASPFQPGLQDFDVVFEVQPYALLPQESIASVSSSADPYLAYSLTNIPGTAPALGQLTVVEQGSQARRFLAWGVEKRHYAPALAIYKEGEAMSALNSAVAAAIPTGSAHGAGSNTMKTAALTSSLVQYASATLAHVGYWRVWMRMYADASGAGSVRAEWACGGNFNNPTLNDAATVLASRAQLVDLGVLAIPEALVGSQTTELRISSKAAGGGRHYYDLLTLIPADECYGEVRASPTLTSDAVLGSGKTTIIRYDGVRRENATGVFGPVYRAPSDPLLIPPGNSRLVFLSARELPGQSGVDNQVADATAIGLDIIPRVLWLPDS